MLTRNHPDAWNADRAPAHLDTVFAGRYIAAGGQLVVTPQMRQVISGMPTALDRGAAIVVDGPAGAGKTTLIEALAAVADVNVAVADIPAGLTARGVWDVINTAVTGHTGKGTATDIQRDTLRYLTCVPTLLIIDEAQHIGLPALMQLRWLWGQAFSGNRFAIMLVGSDLIDLVDAKPAIGTRIDRRILLRHHTPERMVDLLTRHHPQLAGTNRDLLLTIDAAYAHGSWRRWSKFLLTLANDFKSDACLDSDLAARVIQSITGFQPALASPVTPVPALGLGRR